MRKILCVLALLVCCILLLTIPAFARENAGSCGDNAFWSFDRDSGVLKISGTGRLYDYPASGVDSVLVPWKYLRKDIKKIVVEEGITYLGEYTTNKLPALTEVVLPGSITELVASQFSNCSSLTDVLLSDGLQIIGLRAFENCVSLKTIRIPNSVTVIGNDIFSGCRCLETVILSEYLTEIPDGAFEECASLKNISIPDDVTTIGQDAFSGCDKLESVTFPSQLKTIKAYAFLECRALTEINLPQGVESIKSSAFQYCSGLTSVVIPNSVTEVGSNAFATDGNLRAIVFMGAAPKPAYRIVYEDRTIGYYSANDPSWTQTVLDCLGCVVWVPVEDIGRLELPKEDGPLFAACGENATARLENGVLTIEGTGAVTKRVWGGFSKNIKKVVVSNGITSLCDYAFLNCSILTQVTLPDTLTDLGNYAFSGCSNLTQIKLPDTLTGLGNYVFQGCKKLSQVKMPEGMTIIPKGTFSGCAALEKFEISDKVTTVGDAAFSGCAGLKSLVIPASVTELGEGFIAGCSNLAGPAFLGSMPAMTSKTFNSFRGYAFIKDHRLWNLESLYFRDVQFVIGTGGTTGQCGEDMFWHYEDGVLYITGRGVMWDFTPDIGAPWLHLTDSVKRLSIEGEVTVIGHYAFYAMTSLQNVTMSDTVVSVGERAFASCIMLESVKFSNKLNEIHYGAFSCCQALENLDLPESLKFIYDFCFGDCQSLKSVKIPSNVEYIGSDAFFVCRGLKQIYFDGNAPRIHETAFTDVIATATYPKKNPTWTKQVLQNYSGTITWKEMSCTSHKYGSWVQVSAPSVQKEGMEERTCTECGYTEKRQIPVLPTEQPQTTRPTESITPTTARPTAPANQEQQKDIYTLFSEEALSIVGMIVGAFALISIAIFISILVLKIKSSQEGD